jgi:hypothetical protein
MEYADDEFVTGPFSNLFFLLGCLDDAARVATPAQMYQVALLTETCASEMEKWGLRVSATHARTLFQILDGIVTNGGKPIGTPGIHDQVTLLRQALHIELEATVFVNVESAKAAYFRTPLTDVSDDVRNNFSSTLFDLTEAAKCYALGRSTASVSHCMRVVEVGLIALGLALHVPEAETKNWGNLLDQIDKRIKSIGPSHGTDWREQQAYHSTVAAQFGAFRVAWRNNVMHAHEKYTELEAREVLAATRAFMRQIAMKLHD